MTVNKTSREFQSAIKPHHPARWARPTGVTGGAVAAVLTWTIARFGAGLHLRTPAFSGSAHPASLSANLAFFVAILVAAAGWALLVGLEHWTKHPRRLWLSAGGIAFAVSLAGPLSGHGVSAADRLGLVCMHVAVAAVVLPVLAVSSSPRISDGINQTTPESGNAKITVSEAEELDR
ncbi:MAG: hypothetical protein EPN30_02450 [Actinomycetota bacterium]|nr:MAG: hypothetical protein EPN30_02450 [Actinomycetota bacterium]